MVIELFHRHAHNVCAEAESMCVSFPKKPARWGRFTGWCIIALAVASMVSMAWDVKLDLSMRIARRGVLTEVAIAADVSVVAAQPCAVGG